ncbi:hypothetical protein [Alicyclobacillus macrosporangiidus]|uniref:Type IV leader peptidase family protein n=1 Tax=Alicyclobacillus macrosporangiidus TaxID=392015 RepID=A0A1I7LET0_9BACL|nr:hypothetical protein [Alicyclobacillus macrosporangiidus]SFV08181.1 hypothetical protein SAMN05421543_1429 [Alicyclobacillus macrosporangiidus]
MAHLWSYSAAWLTVGFLSLCAITDVLYRRVSETAICCFALAVMFVHFSWVAVVSGLLCAVLWWVSDRRNAALGDIEMAALTGLGLGPFSLIAIATSCALALLTRPWWPRLSSRMTPPEERHLAPSGLYLAVGALLTILIVPWLVAGFQEYTAFVAIHVAQ